MGWGRRVGAVVVPVVDLVAVADAAARVAAVVDRAVAVAVRAAGVGPVVGTAGVADAMAAVAARRVRIARGRISSRT